MHIHLDPLGGIAGDMFLAASLAANLVDKADLEAALQTLDVGPVRIVTEDVKRGAFTGTHVHFEGWRGEAEHPHRHLSTIVEMLEASELPEPVRARATAMFRTLGEAEAGVHGVALEKIHFHEVGALDSIFDFVCAAWIIERTDATWSMAPTSVGTGTRMTEHGTVPIPVPATAELLRGLDVVPREVEAELVTPTGAAILCTLHGLERFASRPAGKIRRVAYGAGTRDLDGLANVLRLLLIEPASRDGDAETTETTDQVVRLVCEIDDMNPEVLAHVAGRLLQASALDVVREAVVMKKGRHGTRLSVLCAPDVQDQIVDLILRETSTFGLRHETVERVKLARRMDEVTTPFGTVPVKIGLWKGRPIKAAPEYEDCARRAAEADVPLREVFDAAQAAARSLLNHEGS